MLLHGQYSFYNTIARLIHIVFKFAIVSCTCIVAAIARGEISFIATNNKKVTKKKITMSKIHLGHMRC